MTAKEYLKGYAATKDQADAIEERITQLRELRERVQAVRHNGIVPETDINRGSDGAVQFWVRDPDGNRIEFMEYLPESKQLL